MAPTLGYYGEDRLIQLLLISVFSSVFNFKIRRSLLTFSFFGAPRYLPMYLFKPHNLDISHLLPGVTFIDVEQVDVRKISTIFHIVAQENFVKIT